MKKIIEKTIETTIYLICILITLELLLSIYSLNFLIPTKNAVSYGYVNKNTKEVIIPLDKYNSRIKAQLSLPFELIVAKINNKTLIKSFDRKTGKFGYVDNDNNIIIEHKFTKAEPFRGENAVVATIIDGKEKYGMINTKGEWVIKPIYDYLCPFSNYYIKACVDNEHCGVIDRYGNNITLMTYNTKRLRCKNDNCRIKFCQIGKKDNVSCNYFL